MKHTFRPLRDWPGKRTTSPRRSVFKATYSQTLELLDRELLKLEAKQIVIQVDLPESKIRLDGLPRSGACPEYPGIILAFESKYGPLKYATDTFDHWKDNLRAIALGLEALRKVDRYGITKRGEQYTGWKQLSDGSQESFDVNSSAGFIAQYSESTTIGEIKAHREVYRKAYRQAAMKLHPDKGGAQEDFWLLQKAKSVLDAHFGI